MHRGRTLGKGILRKILKDAESALMNLSDYAKNIKAIAYQATPVTVEPD